jgi:phosphomannomutase
MTLIKSISGIRGTIGGPPGDNLTPPDIVRFTVAFCRFIQLQHPGKRIRIVVGRDARISGPMVHALVCQSIVSLGADVVDLGLTTTPTVEVAVTAERADAGIILTASHNPAEWNALKLLNSKGEFIAAADGEQVLRLADQEAGAVYAPVHALGVIESKDYLETHIQQILALPLVDREAIAAAGLKIVVDPVNSSGGIYVPALLEALGVYDVQVIHGAPDGHFAHNPEPLAEHLSDLSSAVVRHGAHMGITVDPDVDRLAFVCEDGSMFGEEYTLVAVADYVLSRTPGNTVSNLSSTRALRDVTQARGGNYTAAAVGEVNVVSAMKETGAVIGGEGNGGIIYPELHYGRDALAGIALFLSHYARTAMSMTVLRKSYPSYEMTKKKVDLHAGLDIDQMLSSLAHTFAGEQINRADGLKIDFAEGWVHLRKSNTEPIVRIYSEGKSRAIAEELSGQVIREIQQFM